MQWLIMLGLLVCPSAAAQDPETQARIAEAWPEIEVAAAEAGLEPRTLAALLVVESRLLPVEGKLADVHGLGQVSWSWWGDTLRGEGYDLADLYHPTQGILAAGLVLGRMRLWFGPMADWRLLCLWSDGTQATGYRESCAFSRHVLQQAQLVQPPPWVTP